MDKQDETTRAREALSLTAELIERASDSALWEILGNGLMDRLLHSIAKPKEGTDQSIYDYLLSNKTRLTLMARIRHAITQNYSVMGVLNGRDLFVSPTIQQWFDDGVMFVQGAERFAGLIGLYQNGRVKFALAARDARKGEELGPEHFLFVDVEDVLKDRASGSQPTDLSQLDAARSELDRMLSDREERESEYQRFLANHPWTFGAQYQKIQSHRALDDGNIPDFTGVRVRDGARDIFEIKNPFLNLFRTDGSFASGFNDAWNQAERYLDFVRREEDYLRRQKGLRFENPHCYLLVGHRLDSDQLSRIRAKERMNPAVTVMTYDDVLTLVEATARFVRQLSAASAGGQPEDAGA